MPKGERPLEPGDDVVVQFARDLRLLREKAGSPTYRELSARAHYSAAALSDAAGGRKLPSLPVTLAYVTACGGDTAAWEARWRQTAAELTATKADPSPSVADNGGRVPYVGLAAFQQEDADRFFGRDALVTELLTQLRQRRFLGVFGASGCGKSSLLRAGLAAHLAAERERDGAPVVVFTPGQHPVEECAIHLARFLGEAPGTLRDEFTTDPRNLHLRIRQATTDSSAESDVVLVVDQFEELFTLCLDEEERAAFIDALVTATTDATSRTRVVLGVRADFLGHCGQHPSLVTALRDAQVLVGSMTTDELRLAITGPAQQVGYRVETALVARLIADAGQQPGMLPLVSYALLQTWRRRQGQVMTLAGYDAVGGIEHALARTAEQTYQALDTEQQDLTQQIFLRLTALGEGTEDTKRRVARDELDHDNPNTAPVLDTLTRARLITVGHASVEIAHEALIRHWPRLRDWLADDRDGHRLQRQLTDAAAEWERHQRDEGQLYRGARLAAWQDRPLDLLNDTERAFLTASRRIVDRERTARLRRLRWALTAMGVVVVVVSLLAGLAVMQTTRAALERDVALSRQLATSARSQLQIDPELALLLAIEAVEVKPTAEADAVLRQAVVDSRVLATLQTGFDASRELVVSPDGRRIVAGDEHGRLHVWEQPESGGAWSAAREMNALGTSARRPAFSPDGRYLAAEVGDTVQVWDMSQAGKPVTVRGQALEFRDIVFSEDGRQIVAVEDDEVWSLDPTGERDPVLIHRHDEEYAPELYGCKPSPDGRYVACSVISEGTTLIEDLAGQRNPVKILREGESSVGPTISPDGRYAAAGNVDGTVQVWDTADGHEITTLRVHENSVNSVEFGPDGTSVISSGSDGTIRITNIGSEGTPWLTPSERPQGANSLTLRGHQGAVRAATFSPDGSWIASAGSDGTLRLWSATSGETVRLRGHTGPVWDAVFTPDGSHIVTAGQDGTVRIRDRDGANQVILHQYTAGIVGAFEVDVSPNGRLIASVGEDHGELRVWDISAHPTLIVRNTGDYRVAAFTTDNRIITGDAHGTIRTWKAAGGGTQLLDTIALRGEGADLIGVNLDGKLVAKTDRNDGIRVQRLNRPEDVVELPALRVSALMFSPDGRELATGDAEGIVKISSTNGQGEPRRLYGHRNRITSVAYSPDGHYLVTSGSDGTLRIWDTTGNNESVLYRSYYAPIYSVKFSPDGRYLLTTHEDGTVRVQLCEPCGTTQQILDLARSRTTRSLTTQEKKTFGLA